MSIRQADLHRPRACSESDVFYDRLGRSPPPANKIAETHSAFVHAHANIKNHKPFHDDHRNVARHSTTALHMGLRMLLCGVLKEIAYHGQSYKNRNENNRMPRRSNERAARRARGKVRICRHRVWHCTVGDQSSLPSGIVDDAAVLREEMINLAQSSKLSPQA
jgi:hypothetical protein